MLSTRFEMEDSPIAWFWFVHGPNGTIAAKGDLTAEEALTFHLAITLGRIGGIDTKLDDIKEGLAQIRALLAPYVDADPRAKLEGWET